MPFPPKKKPATMIAIGLGAPGPMDREDKKPARRPVSERNHAQETPGGERAFHEEGAAPSATPESVGYRTADQSCGNCEYMDGTQCVFLQQAVGEGDSCARFEARTEDQHEGAESQAEEESESEFA